MVLAGELSRFPQYYWMEVSELELRQLLRYFFEQRLGWDIEDIKENVTARLFKQHKLGGMFNIVFLSHVFELVDFTYPGQIKEWELRRRPMNYWTKEKCIEATKHILEKEQWTVEDVKNRPSPEFLELFKKYKVTTILGVFNNSPYALINAIYPDKFKPWELSAHVPNGYWNLETGILATRWLIEEKLKWTTEDIKTKYGYSVFEKYRLQKMLEIVFNSSPYQAINATYPGRFSERDLKATPRNFWTKEKAISETKKALKGLSDKEIIENISFSFLKEKGLSVPLGIFWDNSPYKALENTYPNRFKKEDFKTRK